MGAEWTAKFIRASTSHQPQPNSEQQGDSDLTSLQLLCEGAVPEEPHKPLELVDETGAGLRVGRRNLPSRCFPIMR